MSAFLESTLQCYLWGSFNSNLFFISNLKSTPAIRVLHIKNIVLYFETKGIIRLQDLSIFPKIPDTKHQNPYIYDEHIRIFQI